MDRLTIKAESLVGKHYGLKCMLNEYYDPDGAIPKEISCNDYCAITRPNACLKCGIQAAFDKLAAYEDTGLTPEEIKALQKDSEKAYNSEKKVNGKSEKELLKLFLGHFFVKLSANIVFYFTEQECEELADFLIKNGVRVKPYIRLEAYEDTGLTPEEIKALQEDNEKLHKLIDEIEETILHEKVSK